MGRHGRFQQQLFLQLTWGRVLAFCFIFCLVASQEAQQQQRKQYPDGYFALCLVVKDQNKDLREFVQYHKWIGTEKIYIYDHNSTVPLLGEVADFVRSGLVEYIRFAGHHLVPPAVPHKLFHNTGQGFAYDDCLRRARHRHAFMGFIDTDEFLVIRDPAKKNIRELLMAYEEYGGLAVNWAIYGSSGLLQRPSPGVLPHYFKCAPVQDPMNLHVKTIANMKHVASIGSNPHYFNYLPGKYAVNAHFEAVQGAFTKNATWDRIVLNHYVVKSREEYTAKVQRGGGSGSLKNMDFFELIDVMCTDECRFAQPLYEKCCAAGPV